jgi:Heterokaryon incompatibility protein (HET)
MNEIYSEARTIIVWLGREDLFALPAVQVLLDICKMPADIIPLMKQQDDKQFSIRDYESLGLRKIQEVEWLSVYAFLNRNWFRRAWILQELAISHRIFVMSGRLMMAWGMLAMSCRILVESHWYDTIAYMARCYMEGRSASRFKNLQAPLTHDPEAYKPYILASPKPL